MGNRARNFFLVCAVYGALGFSAAVGAKLELYGLEKIDEVYEAHYDVKYLRELGDRLEREPIVLTASGESDCAGLTEGAVSWNI